MIEMNESEKFLLDLQGFLQVVSRASKGSAIP